MGMGQVNNRGSHHYQLDRTMVKGQETKGGCGRRGF